MKKVIKIQSRIELKMNDLWQVGSYPIAGFYIVDCPEDTVSPIWLTYNTGQVLYGFPYNEGLFEGEEEIKQVTGTVSEDFALKAMALIQNPELGESIINK